MQHYDRCPLILRNGDLPIAELPDSIHIPLEIHTKYKMIPGLAIRESCRHSVEKIFPDITANYNAPE